MKYLILLFLLFVAACGTATKRSVESSEEKVEVSKEIPAWVNAPEESCKSYQLCAVGEGAGLMMASANARKEISKVFETKVKAKLKSNEFYLDDKMSSQIQNEIEEVTENVLKGVEIKETFDDGTSFYAFAYLNKIDASKSVKEDIDKIDAEMVSLKNQRGLKSYRKLKQLYNKREYLNERHRFLTKSGVRSPISYKDILKGRALVASTIIAIDLEGDQTGEMAKTISLALTENEYKVVEKKYQKRATHHVVGEFTSKKQYLKVSGFEKYEFTLQLNSQRTNGKKLGSITMTEVATGRDYAQALGNALKMIRTNLKEKIIELNID